MSRLVLAGLLGMLAIAQEVPQRVATISAEDSEWLGHVGQRALDALMPMDVPGMRAAYRTSRDTLDEVERYFAIAIASAPSDRLEATVAMPVGGSIKRQLLAQYRRDVRASFESILVRVAVRRVMVDSAACPAIRTRMDALSALNLSVRDDKMIRLDHSVHEIAVWFSRGGIDARMYDESYPLVRWAIDTHEALMACGRAAD